MLVVPTPDIPNWIILVGAGIGSAVSGFIASKAKKTSDRSAKAVDQVSVELQGPGLEPSLRQMVRDSTQTVLDQCTRLHDDHVNLKNEVANRMTKLEESDATQAMTVTAVKSLEGQLASVVGLANRHGLNLHLLANKVQCKLLTSEEANEIMAKRSEEESKLDKSQTKQP